MISLPGSSPVRRGFQDSWAEKRVLLEIGPRPADHPGVYDYLRRLLANYRNTVLAKLLRTPGVLSARSVEMCSESAHARLTYEYLGHCDHTNSLEERKTANKRERVNYPVLIRRCRQRGRPGGCRGPGALRQPSPANYDILHVRLRDIDHTKCSGSGRGTFPGYLLNPDNTSSM
ncbi:hypothetical protein EVAR_83672_1 [Eumeta japonica]|uniref:Uncharacterized protein n=1 Tax=Eumeta variegata TaxID=151549 RepID=A0A4C1UNL9_EUMVA|nr:hypothetical protein EVAR_83672_1 [Eumeta japonica]